VASRADEEDRLHRRSMLRQPSRVKRPRPSAAARVPEGSGRGGRLSPKDRRVRLPA
jgi:hypothetical protein